MKTNATKKNKPVWVEIEIAGKKRKRKFPDDVPLSRYDVYREWFVQSCSHDLLPKSYATSKGVVYMFPVRDVNRVKSSSVLSETDKTRILERDATWKESKRRLDELSELIWGDEKRRKEKEEFFERTGDEIVTMLGQGKTASEVHKVMLERGEIVKRDDITEFHNRNKETIDAIRESFDGDIRSVGVSSKRGRLEKLNYLLNECIEQFEQSQNPTTKKELARTITSLLEQARKECEGEQLKLTVDGKIDVDANVNVMMKSENVVNRLTVAQIVIARVAGRTGASAGWLSERLANSFYKKHNGFRRTDDLSTKPIYPTAVPYDITDDDLRRKNAKWEASQTEVKEKEKTEIENVERQSPDKETLKKNLKKILLERTKL